MVESKREAWHEIVKKSQDTGCDGFELNFGCPHGMSERGMGAAMGQVPEYTCMVTEWVKEVSTSARDCETYAKCHAHCSARTCRAKRWSGCGIFDQYDQFRNRR